MLREEFYSDFHCIFYQICDILFMGKANITIRNNQHFSTECYLIGQNTHIILHLNSRFSHFPLSGSELFHLVQHLQEYYTAPGKTETENQCLLPLISYFLLLLAFLLSFLFYFLRRITCHVPSITFRKLFPFISFFFPPCFHIISKLMYAMGT